MKRIQIKEIKHPDKSSVYINQKQYCIFLGNELRYYFKSEKAALKFLADTNRMLNNKLHELNYIYGLVFIEYRKIWFYCENRFKEFDDKFNSITASINKKFDIIVARSHWNNGNYLTFKHMFDIARLLSEALIFIKKLYNHKNYYKDLQLIDMNLDRISKIVEGLKNWKRN